MKTKYLYLIVALIGVFSCNTTKLTVKKIDKPIKANNVNLYNNFWSAFYCAMPEMTNEHINYNEQEKLAGAFQLLKVGKLNSAENILKDMLDSKNDTIATAAKKLLSSIMFYNSNWSACDSIFRLKHKIRQKKVPIYLDYMDLPKEELKWKQEVDTIRIQIIKGLPIVPVKLNGIIYNFLLDTGCDITCLTQSVADRLKLPILGQHNEGVMNSIGDFFDIASSAMDSINICGLTAYHHPIIITSDKNLTFEFKYSKYFEFEGIIGWNILKNMDFTIDFKNELLIVRKPTIRNDAVKNMFWLGSPIIRLFTEDGIELNFAFDTGDQVTNIFELLIQKTQPKNIEIDKRKVYGVGGSKMVDIKRLPNLKLYFQDYEMQLDNIETGVEIQGIMLCLDGRLGSDFMVYSKIRIDALNNNIEYYRYNVGE